MPRQSHPRHRRTAGWWRPILVLLVLAWFGHWAWQQAFMAYPRAMWELSRLPAPQTMSVPVKGVRARDIADTFGAPRGAQRSHAGVDIFAPRGTPVLSATRGVVTSLRDGGLGGRQVWLLGPGREAHYYAHLEDWAPGLRVREVVEAGDVLGLVGDSGNARGTPPHLHYGVYTSAGAIDPLPRFKAHPSRR